MQQGGCSSSSSEADLIKLGLASGKPACLTKHGRPHTHCPLPAGTNRFELKDKYRPLGGAPRGEGRRGGYDLVLAAEEAGGPAGPAPGPLVSWGLPRWAAIFCFPAAAALAAQRSFVCTFVLLRDYTLNC